MNGGLKIAKVKYLDYYLLVFYRATSISFLIITLEPFIP
jgi:hypothetical protein